MEVINVKTSTFESKIHIGEDVIDTRLPLLTKAQKNFVVTDSNVYALYSDFFKKYFPNTELFVLPAGEENKTFQSLNAILLKMAEAGLHRTSRLFAVGGGVVGDIAGLAAALFMRGISCVQIPTTLLSQVDSSVGGKTAVDLGGIKNVVGAFYQPCEVLINPNFLKTLPMRELKCGIGEIVKYAALSSSIFDTIERNTEQLTDLSFLTKLIKDCVAHKAQVVENDEKETGERKSLNVGHTTGHAIELTHNLSHGECVLYGMLFETRMAIAAGVCEENYGKRLLNIIEKALAIEPSEEIDVSNIEQDAEKARLDKKNADDGKIKMAVAKNYGEWTMYSLPFEEYRNALKKAL
jgi:3-dehydroquinate synthase